MLKRKPIRPKIRRSKANPEVQKKLKTQRSRSNETGTDRAWHGLPVVLTMDRGEGRTVACLGRTALRPLCSQNSSSSFATVRFPARFSVLSCYFVLKRGVYLAFMRSRIHRKTLFHSQKLHWRRRRKKKSGEAKAAFLVANRKIGTQALHKLSYLLCFLLFSSILVRISEFCLVC